MAYTLADTPNPERTLIDELFAEKLEGQQDARAIHNISRAYAKLECKEEALKCSQLAITLSAQWEEHLTSQTHKALLHHTLALRLFQMEDKATHEAKIEARRACDLLYGPFKKRREAYADWFSELLTTYERYCKELLIPEEFEEYIDEVTTFLAQLDHQEKPNTNI